MNKPESVEDVWPHTETVLFLTDTTDCFGGPISDLMEVLSNCEHLSNTGSHAGNDLSADFHRFGRDRVKNIQEIIPNSLLFIHCDIIIETELATILRGSSIPKSSHVVILLDDSKYQKPAPVMGNTPRSIEIAYSRKDVLKEGRRYFTRICPTCQGPPARSWVLDWKKAVHWRVDG